MLWASGTAAMLCAQTTADAPDGQKSAVSVPFVGCASFGQVEALPAPKGADKTVKIAAKDAAALAYYLSADGIGLLAPRGWYCVGTSGSGGSALYLSPKPIDLPMRGVAILVVAPPHLIGFPPNLILVSTRFPSGLAKLTPTILRNLERETVGDVRR